MRVLNEQHLFIFQNTLNAPWIWKPVRVENRLPLQLSSPRLRPSSWAGRRLNIGSAVLLCRQLSAEERARSLLDCLRALFWDATVINNLPSVVQPLPKEAGSENTEPWVSQDRIDPWEGALGLIWFCFSDRYRHRPVEYQTLTLREVCRILTSQYDPLGFIIPLTTRAKNGMTLAFLMSL